MSDWQKQLSSLVYSTEQGRIEPEPDAPTVFGEAFADGKLRISRQTKGRKGKGVIIIEGLTGTADELKSIAQQIKKKCGIGGAFKDGVIEIQGDDREKVKAVLASLGYDSKIAGG